MKVHKIDLSVPHTNICPTIHRLKVDRLRTSLLFEIYEQIGSLSGVKNFHCKVKDATCTACVSSLYLCNLLVHCSFRASCG